MEGYEDPKKVKALVQLHKQVNKKNKTVLTYQSKDAIKIYMNEMHHDLKALKRALTNQDFPMIRHSSYGIKMNADWILDIIKKYEQ